MFELFHGLLLFLLTAKNSVSLLSEVYIANVPDPQASLYPRRSFEYNQPTAADSMTALLEKRSLVDEQQEQVQSLPRRFKCNQCGKSYSRRDGLLRHRANCRIVTLVPCDYCDKTFTRTDNKNNHMRNMHGIYRK